MRGRGVIRVAVGLTLACGAGLAKPPQVDGIFPAGGQRGTEIEVAVSGTLDPWPVEVRVDRDGVVFVPDAEQKGRYRVRIGEDAGLGGCLVWFVNAEGVSAPRQFVVGIVAERREPGDEPWVVTPAELPVVVNGKLEADGEVDRFAVDLQAGEVLAAEVSSYALDAPLDPLLHLRGPRGEQLAFNHDATPLGLDPRLEFEAPATARYELHLAAFAHPPQANIRFAGGATAIYRLTVARERWALELPAPHEAEGDQPRVLVAPAAISGTIDPAGETDRYRFAAAMGDLFRIEVGAAEFGSWMDPVLVVRDAAGKEVARHDDLDSQTQLDAGLDWSAPAEGEFTAEVRDLNGAGGSGIGYQFRLTKPEPSFAVTAAGAVHAITPGKTLEMALKVVRRHGHGGALEAGIEGLPPGVSAGVGDVNEKGEVKLVLEAAADAAPAIAPITIWAGPKGDPAGRVAGRFELKGAHAEAGDLLVNHTGRGWLTVAAP